MSANLNYGNLLGKAPNKEIYTPRLNAMRRSQSQLSLPCEPQMDDLFVPPPRSSHGYGTPNPGNMRESKWGLARSDQHPTNLPLLKSDDPFNHGKTIKFKK